MSIEITVSGPALERLGQLRNDLAGDAVKAAAGGGVRRLLQTHFKALDQARANQLGGKRSHFYAAAARSVTYETDATGVTIGIHHPGIALHYFGGVVKPVNSRYLTIPVDPSAYGRRAGEFDNLRVQYGMTRGGRPRPMFLVQDSEYKYKVGKNRKTGVQEVKSVTYETGKIMYYLALSATMRPDPSVLPSDETINQAAIAAMIARMGTAR